jgi:hypothetical protein
VLAPIQIEASLMQRSRRSVFHVRTNGRFGRY